MSARRYFAQVGKELLEIDPDHVDLHKAGASFSTSAPVLNYRITATVGNPDAGGAVYHGFGSSWEEAEAAIDAQLPKESA